MSRRIIKRAFEKNTYRFQDRPESVPERQLDIHVNVPFCQALCSFCPFYKELYNFKQCSKYVDAIIHEIDSSPFNEKSDTLHFGGGTPNMLTVHQLLKIKDAVQARADVKELEIELLPDVLNPEYIKELRIAKFTRVSLGIETMQPGILKGTGRSAPGMEEISQLVKEVKYRGLGLNLNFMIGLPGQSRNDLLKDMKTAAELNPEQITISPFMKWGNMNAAASMPDREQYGAIEDAAVLLERAGYERNGLWNFARAGKANDTFRNHLVGEFIGFGPGAFSRYDQWDMANPELGIYLEDWKSGRSRVLAAPGSREIHDWIRFASMLYDMDFSDSADLVKEQRKLANMLKKSGFVDKAGRVTEKGLPYAHEMLKIIIEHSSCILHDPKRIENYNEYQTLGRTV